MNIFTVDNVTMSVSHDPDPLLSFRAVDKTMHG